MKLPLRLDRENEDTSLPYSKDVPKTAQSNMDIVGLLQGQTCRQALVKVSATLSTHQQAFMFRWEVTRNASKLFSPRKIWKRLLDIQYGNLGIRERTRCVRPIRLLTPAQQKHRATDWPTGMDEITGST